VINESVISETDVTAVPSATGITTKVLKGSIWTLAGQVSPMAVSLFTTPFVIRFLGSEQYGVLVLVGLIPAYFAFADLGMGIASTRFASEAYAQGDQTKEAETVWTATVIAFASSITIGLPILLFSASIISALKVPEYFQYSATTALRIAAVSFVAGILSSVVNTPQLTRLRMDLNTAISAIPRILVTIATPIILYAGFGIVGAVIGWLVANVATGAGHIYISGRLQPQLFHARWNRAVAKRLFKFAFGWLFASIAAILLVNAEKLALTRMVSVQSLAYYSVAFMFATLVSTFSGSMIQSLIPAFSQLLAPEKKNEFQALFARSMRFNLAWLLPTVMIMLVAARPFLTLWAGEEFGRESTGPFYILIAGIFFNVLALIPQSTLFAHGRTDLIAKLYWIELPLYLILVFGMVNFFGIAGAAAAWSLRVTADMLLMAWLAKKNSGVVFDFGHHAVSLLFASSFLSLPIGLALFYDNFSLILIPVSIASAAGYLAIVWRRYLEAEERDKIRTLIGNLWQRVTPERI
jgi:O-antigen/teichoic acid export membrane protein